MSGGWWWVSPHPDDAVFSSASAMIAAVGAGREVGVLTVFGRDPARAAEDAVALGRLGVRGVALGLADAPERRAARSARELLADLEVRADEVAAVVEALMVLRPERVVLPLAVGGHIDHRACCAAWRDLGCELAFYEDRPYADVPGLVDARLGRPAPGAVVGLAAAGWFTAHVPEGERAALAAEVLRAKGPSLPPLTARVIPAADPERVRAAWSAYGSQAAFLPDSVRAERVWHP